MKKMILLFVSLIVVVGLAFTSVEFQPSESTATVKRVEGVLIFTDSEPVQSYDYLGTVERTVVFGNSKNVYQYERVRNGLIDKAKEKYSNCDAIIIHTTMKGADKADVIKFKK